MNEQKKRVLVIGLLILCLFPPSRDGLKFILDSPDVSLGALVAIAGAWACICYLWRWEIRCWRGLAWGALVFAGVAIGSHVAFHRSMTSKQALESAALSSKLEKANGEIDWWKAGYQTAIQDSEELKATNKKLEEDSKSLRHHIVTQAAKEVLGEKANVQRLEELLDKYKTEDTRKSPRQ